MFCITLAEKNYNSFIKCLERGCKYTNLFEIRVDFLDDFNISELKKLLKLPYRFIFTFRSYEEGGIKKVPEELKLKYISWALNENFYLVDLEWKLFKKFCSNFKNINFNKVLVSYHNFKKTPSDKSLYRLIREMSERGVKKAKISCMANSIEDSFRLLNLIFYAKKKNIELVSFGMGDKGKLSRILSLFCGAPFSYVVLPRKKTVAPGQLDIVLANSFYKTLKKLI